MDEQEALFPEYEAIQESAVVPEGFQYREGIISDVEESSLVTALSRLDLKPFEFRGYLANRRVVSFGFRYDYTQGVVKVAEGLPAFLTGLRVKVAEFAGRSIDAFEQASVIEYRPGAGIGWHRDKPQFGVIVGVSLLTPATMRFRRAVGNRWERISRTLRPRSIYLLEGEARTLWEHSIPPLDALRYSLTFRTLREDFKPS